MGAIVDDDPPPTISISDVTVTEGDTGTTDAVFTVSLSAPSGLPVTVGFTTTSFGATAEADVDYVPNGNTLTFAPGETAKTLTVQVLGDTLDEPDETYFVVLFFPGNATVADFQGVGTIAGDDTALLSIDDVTVAEGDTGTTDAAFTVSLSIPSSVPVTVDFATADDSATAGLDYTATSGTLTFAPGETARTVSVAVTGDTGDEPDEAFVVQLANLVNATPADTQGRATITDDDLALISIADVTVTEGDTGTTDALFTVSLASPAGQTVTVAFATFDVFDTAGVDYIPTSGTLTFDPGDQTRTIAVPVIGDTLYEPNELVFVNLSDPTNAVIADGQGAGIIANDDPPPPQTLSIDDVTVVEGDAGTTDAMFTISLSVPAAAPVSVHVSTNTFNATADYSDLNLNGTELTFAPGETARTLTVQVLGDTLDEPDEIYFVDLVGPTNATIADYRGVGTIIDDDAAPTLAIDDLTLAEGDTGTTDAVFTVSLSGASGRTVTVDFATADDSATAGSDYTATSGTLTFAPGETARTVSVAVTGDTGDEPDEAFVVQLANLVNATPADTQGRATITDDDLALISIADVTVTEGDTGTTDALFTVSLASPAGQTVTVDFATFDVFDTAGVDYIPTSGTLTFDPGDQTRTIAVPVIGDTLYEPNELVFVNLSDPTNAVIADGQGAGIIANDDPPPPQTLSIDDVTVVEGDAGTTDAVFTISLSVPAAAPVSVHVSTNTFNATADYSDLNLNGTELTFAPGETARTLTVQVLGDTLDEPDEIYFVDLVGPTNATIADYRGVGTIIDDDGVARPMSIADATVNEGNSGVTEARVHGLPVGSLDRDGDRRLRHGQRDCDGRIRLHRDRRHLDVRTGRPVEGRACPGHRRQPVRARRGLRRQPVRPDQRRDRGSDGDRHDRQRRCCANDLDRGHVRHRG